MYTRPTAAFLLCFFVLNGLVAFNSAAVAVSSQTKAKQNTIAVSENNMEQQTPPSVISSAADGVNNRKDFAYYSTTSFSDYPDGKRGFFECKPPGNRCSVMQRCCGALECHRERFFHFFGRCY